MKEQIRLCPLPKNSIVAVFHLLSLSLFAPKESFTINTTQECQALIGPYSTHSAVPDDRETVDFSLILCGSVALKSRVFRPLFIGSKQAVIVLEVCGCSRWMMGFRLNYSNPREI